MVDSSSRLKIRHVCLMTSLWLTKSNITTYDSTALSLLTPRNVQKVDFWSVWKNILLDRLHSQTDWRQTAIGNTVSSDWFFASHQQSFSYKGASLPGWTSTKLGLMFLLKDTTQWRRWGSNPRPLGLESNTLPLSHCAPFFTCVTCKMLSLSFSLWQSIWTSSTGAVKNKFKDIRPDFILVNLQSLLLYFFWKSKKNSKIIFIFYPPTLMPRLHLLRSSYDLFIYDFPYDFFGIVGGYKLRRNWLHCLRSPYDFFRRQTRTKPYRDLTNIVRRPQGCDAVIVLSSRPPYTNRTMPVRWPCGSRKESVLMHGFKRP